ncbi:hypothetical protein [Leisingera caerulea]|uniref:hypothetical protein n=1 Tax=Leisingera caerulea TaxID=506591 RepID=UPI00048924E0|nr:hypothetical protein [Leisingera caerulea]
MPIFLEPAEVIDDLKEFRSVLIVSCPICPPMCVSIQQKSPFLQPLKHGLKTPAFEDYIASIREALAGHGVRSEAFTLRLPVPMMCLWTARQRARILKRAQGFGAVLVLGCDSATYTAADALRGTDCKVFQGMEVKTITNATTALGPSATVTLDWHPLPKTPKSGQFNGPDWGEKSQSTRR